MGIRGGGRGLALFGGVFPLAFRRGAWFADMARVNVAVAIALIAVISAAVDSAAVAVPARRAIASFDWFERGESRSLDGNRANQDRYATIRPCTTCDSTRANMV